ncbi:hypothetical protein ABZ816_02740 [Actinosynnema sp. NPDC047251]|uniref:Uncharacterized protein n=1 Tax=Saccharothrix espanaensis (strain ATCC 51144 / DSM 44229 / JCM 9112 / NBRC 15066 / NRRL 15764) TaxID=1179773 RepID=K0JTQ9_SACES|nr:hypothetical protein [Saccharothrix espanaensis]CCH31170.1 hypothetical protein BN6_38810 [Saccharothrix espanaensis DSM 44229]
MTTALGRGAPGLSEDLERLPPALAQAALIRADPELTATGYRRLLDRRRDLAGGPGDAIPADRSTLAATCSLALDHADGPDRAGPHGVAGSVLGLAALLGSSRWRCSPAAPSSIA